MGGHDLVSRNAEVHQSQLQEQVPGVTEVFLAVAEVTAQGKVFDGQVLLVEIRYLGGRLDR